MLGVPDVAQPRAGSLVFGGKSEVDEIAGDGNMIGLVGQHVADHEIEAVARVGATALALPIQIAEPTFDVEMAKRQACASAQGAHPTRAPA